MASELPSPSAGTEAAAQASDRPGPQRGHSSQPWPTFSLYLEPFSATPGSRTASLGWTPSHPARSNQVSWTGPRHSGESALGTAPWPPARHAARTGPVTPGLVLPTRPRLSLTYSRDLRRPGQEWPEDSLRRGWVYAAGTLGSCRRLP